MSDRRRDVIWAALGVAAMVLFWQVATRAQLLGPQFGPAFAPQKAFYALYGLVADGSVWHHLSSSLRRVLYGVALGATVGIPTGVLVGYFPKAEATSSVVFQFLRMISPLAMMPIAIIAFGIGDRPVYFLIAVATVWPFIINTAHGVARVDPLWIKVARSLGATEKEVLLRVVIPAVVPDILTGLRLAIGLGWIVLVPAEMLGVSSGLGYFVLDARDRFQYDQLVAAILLIGLLGFALDGVIRLAQRRYSWTME